MIVLPVLFEGQTKAVIELATLSEFTPTHVAFRAVDGNDRRCGQYH